MLRKIKMSSTISYLLAAWIQRTVGHITTSSKILSQIRACVISLRIPPKRFRLLPVLDDDGLPALLVTIRLGLLGRAGLSASLLVKTRPVQQRIHPLFVSCRACSLTFSSTLAAALRLGAISIRCLTATRGRQMNLIQKDFERFCVNLCVS